MKIRRDGILENQPVQIKPQSLIKSTIEVTSGGNTTVYTPTAGKKIRLYFFGYSGGANVTGLTVKLTLEGYNSGNPFDAQYLSTDGQPYARNILSGASYIEGEEDGLLIVNLSGAQTVHVNYELVEVD